MKKDYRNVIAWDMDNTLCNSIRRWHPEDILKVKPRKKLIKTLKELKKRGYKIIIFTRRDSCGKNARKLTIRWLKKYNIPYDKLITKKPHYDILIDDRACSVHQYLTADIIEKQLINAKKLIDKYKYNPKGKQ